MKHPLRTDKQCLNCGRQVNERYCPYCGQENVESRRSFRELIAHFVEDLTHYEGKVGQTLKYLLFKPAALTAAYLSGMRKRFMEPVRLYIFISFITFILPHILYEPLGEVVPLTTAQLHYLDSCRAHTREPVIQYDSDMGLIYISNFKTLHQLDSAVAVKAMNPFSYRFNKKAIDLQHYTPAKLWELFLDTLANNIPKTIFLFLPLSAFILFLFYMRRRSYYFDHAIFTLHYFSFLLVTISVYQLLTMALGLTLGYSTAAFVNAQIGCFMALVAWGIYYFFRARYLFYGHSVVRSVALSAVVYLLNLVVFAVLFIVLLYITLLQLH